MNEFFAHRLVRIIDVATFIDTFPKPLVVNAQEYVGHPAHIELAVNRPVNR